MIKRGVDIWSLGCIFSEAATWVVKGEDGIEQYAKYRSTAIGRIQDFRNGDFFHNGNSRLPFIDEHHLRLKQDLEYDDTITGRVLETMVDEMLREDNTRRPSAQQLDRKAEDTIRHADAPVPVVAASRRSQGLPPPPTPDDRLTEQMQRHGSILSEANRFYHSPAGTVHLNDHPGRNGNTSPPTTPTRPPVLAGAHNRSLSEQMHGLDLGERGDVGQSQVYLTNESPVESPVTLSQSTSPTTPPFRSAGPSSSLQFADLIRECPLGCGMYMKPESLESHIAHCKREQKKRMGSIEESNLGADTGRSVEQASGNFASRSAKRIPYCSVKQAMTYYEAKKRGDKTAKLTDQDILGELEDRDHVGYLWMLYDLQKPLTWGRCS